jgi:hypothetical protein
LGYAVVAQYVLDQIHQHETLGVDYQLVNPIRLDQIQDDLLDGLPNIWSIAPWLFLDFRRLQGPAVQTDAQHPDAAASTQEQRQAVLDVLGVMNHVATKVRLPAGA